MQDRVVPLSERGVDGLRVEQVDLLEARAPGTAPAAPRSRWSSTVTSWPASSSWAATIEPM